MGVGRGRGGSQKLFQHISLDFRWVVCGSRLLGKMFQRKRIISGEVVCGDSLPGKMFQHFSRRIGTFILEAPAHIQLSHFHRKVLEHFLNKPTICTITENWAQTCWDKKVKDSILRPTAGQDPTRTKKASERGLFRVVKLARTRQSVAGAALHCHFYPSVRQ